MILLKFVFNNRFISLFSLFFLLTAFGLYQTQQVQKPNPNRPARSKMADGEIIVRLKTDLNALNKRESRFHDMVQKLGAKVVSAYPAATNIASKTSTGLENTMRVLFDPSLDPYEVAQEFAASGEVYYAEPRYLRKLAAIPNDLQYPSMPQFQRVFAEAAWDKVKGQQSNVVIAVIDGGFDVSHVDLKGNLWVNTKELPGNGQDDDANGFMDDVSGWNFGYGTNNVSQSLTKNYTHGTHVAGIAAARTDNNDGVASLSWNAKFLPISAGSPKTDDAIAYGFEAIRYAADNGAKIISCSWGDEGTFSQAEFDAVQYAVTRGALVVAAAGNGGADGVGDNNDLKPHYPSSYPSVLAVGSTNTQNDVKSGFSNYGVTVDVFAPGGNVVSTFPNGSYSFAGGTSQATPMVSALAALVKTVKPGYTPLQISEQIRVTADAITSANPSYSNSLGGGRINALRAVSDFTRPAVRLNTVAFTDPNRNEIIELGETITTQLSFYNILSEVSNVRVSLTSTDARIQILSPEQNIGTLGTDQSATANLQFKTQGSIVDGELLRFYVELKGDNGYVDRGFFTLVYQPARFVSHRTGSITTSLTTRGNIGYNGFQDAANGDGFKVNGKDVLFEGSLMIGKSASQLSDAVRGANDSVQDTDFQPVRRELLQLFSPGKKAFEETSIVLSDSIAPNPLFVTVKQESFADTLKARRNFIIMRYTIKNNSPENLTGLKAGLFMDWDISANGQTDYARYDATRRMGYVMDKNESPTVLAGVKLLNSNAKLNFRSIANDPEIYGSGCTGCNGFTTTEKWQFLSSAVQTQTVDAKDVSQLIGMDLPTIEAGKSVEIAFAIIGSNSLDTFNTAADVAQNFYTNTIVANESDAPIPANFVLSQNYPNPFNPSTNISFTLPEAGNVRLEVFDLLGRKVATLIDARQFAGQHNALFDATNLPSGTYFYRLTFSGKQSFTTTRKMVLLR